MKLFARSSLVSVCAMGLFTAGAFGAPATYTYADWTSDTLSTATAPGSASGSMMIGSTAVTLTYSGDVTSATQVGTGGVDYYIPASVYTNSQVANVPSNNTLIALAENPAYTDSLKFSTPLLNPILDIVSLGAPGNAVTYSFSATPTILSQGSAYWGGCATCLSVSGNSLSGTEGSGVIEFMGSYNSISWTTMGGEYWNGFTVGVQGLGSGGGTSTPEPATLATSAISLLGICSFAFLLRKRTN